jgi:hypothetical protein
MGWNRFQERDKKRRKTDARGRRASVKKNTMKLEQCLGAFFPLLMIKARDTGRAEDRFIYRNSFISLADTSSCRWAVEKLKLPEMCNMRPEGCMV